jgi:hypothetical protein
MNLAKALFFSWIVTVGCGSDNGAVSSGSVGSGTGTTSGAGTGSGGSSGTGGANDAGDVMSIETCAMATDDEVAVALQVPSVTHERTVAANSLSIHCAWSAPGTGFMVHMLDAEVSTDANERLLTGGADDTVLSHFTDVKNGLMNQPISGVGDDAFYIPATKMLWIMYHNRMLVVYATNYVDGGYEDSLVPSRAVALDMVGRLP